MKTFEVVSPNFRRGGKELAVGEQFKAETLEPTMVGKAREVEAPRALEVATPQRGRPRKEKDDE